MPGISAIRSTLAPDDRDIALCLSGGGLRATLFHLGLVKALRTHTRNGATALAAVREIYSVSGGSILAAHLIARWASYVGDDAAFAGLEAQVIAFAGRNLRDRVVRRAILTRALGESRGHWLQREYETLLGTGSISDSYALVATGPGRPPMLHILATSFTTGELCSFSCEQFEVEPNGTDPKHEAPAGHLPLAYAVAASSAFPPLFPPVALTADMLRQPEDRRFQETIRLSDGGVFDNLGFEKFRSVHAASTAKVGALIVSNAGGAFHSGLDKAYAGAVSRNARASDILMRRIGNETEKQVRQLAGLTFIDVKIGADVRNPILRPATQKLLRLVRTDLDRFDPELAAMLIDHGYRVGSARLVDNGWTPPATPPPALLQRPDAAQAAIAQRAAERSYRSLWLDGRDWVTVPLIWLLTILLLGAPVAGIAGAITTYRATREENDWSKTMIRAQKIVVAARTQEAKARTAEAAATRAAANEQADLLQRVRLATATGNMETVRRVLAGVIRQTEDIAARPARSGSSKAARPVPPPILNENDVRRIIDDRPVYTIAPAASPYAQQVYIQFAGMLTRAQITALNRGLRQAGWRAQGPSGERTPVAAGKNEVRYSGEANAAAALALANAINSTGILPLKVGTNNMSSIRSDVLELWISR